MSTGKRQFFMLNGMNLRLNGCQLGARMDLRFLWPGLGVPGLRFQPAAGSSFSHGPTCPGSRVRAPQFQQAEGLFSTKWPGLPIAKIERIG